jgi:hypothetical protein
MPPQKSSPSKLGHVFAAKCFFDTAMRKMTPTYAVFRNGYGEKLGKDTKAREAASEWLQHPLGSIHVQ